MLILNGETYTVKKKTAGVKILWSCSKMKSCCKGAVITDDPSGNARNRTAHNHESRAVKTEVTKFQTKIQTKRGWDRVGWDTIKVRSSHSKVFPLYENWLDEI